MAGNSCSHIGWLTMLSLAMMLTFVIQQGATLGLENYRRFGLCGPPAVRPDSCKHGTFRMNFNPGFCKPTTLCLKGISESCTDFGETSDCKENLYCSCGQCSAELDTSCKSKNPSLEELKRLQPLLQPYGYYFVV